MQNSPLYITLNLRKFMFNQIHKTADFEESILVQRQKMYSFKQEISRQLPMACNSLQKYIIFRVILSLNFPL